MNRLKSQDGIALVLTLMILAIITAVVVEFAYGVYTTTSALYNWRDSQRLSFVAKSGVSVALNIISNPFVPKNDLYKYLGRQIPLENVSENFNGRVIISAEDENGKFNLNSIVWLNGQKNAYDSFVRLLKKLGLDQSLADRIAHWISANSDTGLRDSGEAAKNAYMDSVDELLLIKGIDRQTYEKLLPYVTVYGCDGRQETPNVNINTASIPVIMSLADGISEDDAAAIVQKRQLEPFTNDNKNQIEDYGSFRGKGVASKIVTNARNFRITSIGEENKIRRVIECVIDTNGNTVQYWREM